MSDAGPSRRKEKPSRGRRSGEASVRLLAEQLNLSVATISRALNNHPDVSEQTRRRVVEAARVSGYRPSVGKLPTNILGLLLAREQPAEFGSFEAAIVSGILRTTREHGFDLVILDPTRDAHPAEALGPMFQRKGVAGAIIRGKDGPAIAEELVAHDFPAVLVANRSDDPAVSFVDAESRTTSRHAIEHLISLGHRRIALATHFVLDSDHLDRKLGYEEALRRHNLPIDPELIVQAPVDQRGGVMMLNKLLRLDDPPTAIYFTNPLTTVGAMQRCIQLGIRVPGELSIVGFDDSNIRQQTYPPFTAIFQDAVTMSVDATRWLIAAIQGNTDGPFRSLRETGFDIQESTGLAPSSPVRLGIRDDLVRKHDNGQVG